MTQDHLTIAPTLDPSDLTEEDFWHARPELEWIRSHARHKRISPYTHLGVTLARYAADMPPARVLPAYVGGEASLYLGVAIIGQSGQGKSASVAASSGINWKHELHTVGSGEAIVKAFATENRGVTEIHNEHALIMFDEVDTLRATSNRQGSTAMSKLRELLGPSCHIGVQTRTDNRSAVVPRYCHSGAVLVNMQPQKADWILDDWAGGTPQRFLFLPANDRSRDKDAPYPDPGPSPLSTAQLCRGGCSNSTTPAHLDIIKCCAEVHHAIEVDTARRLDAPLGADDDTDMNGHVILTRERVGALLAAMSGRRDIMSEDWLLAGYLVKKSQDTVAEVRAISRRATIKKANEDAVAAGHHAAKADETLDELLIGRTLTLVRKHAGLDGTAKGHIRGRLSPKNRAVYDAALAKGLDEGLLVVEDVAGLDLSGKPTTMVYSV